MKSVPCCTVKGVRLVVARPGINYLEEEVGKFTCCILGYNGNNLSAFGRQVPESHCLSVAVVQPEKNKYK